MANIEKPCPECGLLVGGNSESQWEYNLKVHKKSKAHRQIIQNKPKVENSTNE